MNPEIKKEFQNEETRAKYRMVTDNWNRKVRVPGAFAGLIQDIPPHAVEKYIEMGRKDIVPIEQTKQPVVTNNKPTPKPEAQ